MNTRRINIAIVTALLFFASNEAFAVSSDASPKAQEVEAPENSNAGPSENRKKGHVSRDEAQLARAARAEERSVPGLQ